ncbi:phosphoribosylglycinamide formyltransferase [Paxillus ammoniavirescens]|nr:phosphoribosylglycinamide formyltransferase [Paxillus ammoniavirescens]
MSAPAQTITAHADPPPPRRIAVLISGSGTNLQALIDAAGTPRLPHAQIVLVLSNRKAAKGLARAAAATPPIPTAYLALQPYLRTHPGATREEYDVAVARAVLDVSPDVVVLAGWMHIVSQGFLDVLRGAGAGGGGDVREIPVINLHPALPGQFDGANAMERGFKAFQSGEVDRLGVMVHRVIAEVDRGAPVVVREVEVMNGEALEVYEQRMHRVEWEIIVEGTKMVLDEV